MKILVGKTFGIGNAVMAVPMVKALATLGEVDVLVGTGPDDFGAADVMSELQQQGIIGRLATDSVMDKEYDVAVMAIPFDGRWRNGQHFRSKRVMDCRPRPDFSPVLGFSSWKKHEAEYQFDNAVELGYAGEMPSSSFMFDVPSFSSNSVYVGIGYKRDAAGFWATKHWGNDRYKKFAEEVQRIRPMARFTSTGNSSDAENAAAIRKLSYSGGLTLKLSFTVAACCESYFGNDTGMMHVMASLGKPVYAMNAFDGAEIKNHPLSPRWVFEQFHSSPRSPEDVARSFVDFVWGNA